MKYVVIGFIKCGQVSANTWLQENYPGSPNRNEIIWQENAEEIYLNLHGPDSKLPATPFIIKRDPIERVWSAFRYFQEKNFFDFVMNNQVQRSFGTYNPIRGSNYDKWIEPFKKYDPWIIDLDFMRTKPGFPKENVTPNKDPFPENYKNLTKDLLSLELRGGFWANNGPTDEAFQILKHYTG